MDADDNKHKYGYRCMAGIYNPLTTQKPIGAITNFFLIKADLTSYDQRPNNLWATLGVNMARFSLNSYARTRFRDVNIPKNTRQSGKYIMVKKNSSGYNYPINAYNEVTYRYVVGGASFTYGVENGLTETSDGYGVLSVDEFKNEQTFWSMLTGNVTFQWNNANNQDYTTWKCAYGGSYDLVTTDHLFPVCGVADTNLIALQEDNLTKMKLESTSYNRPIRIDMGHNQRPGYNPDAWSKLEWKQLGGSGDDGSPDAVPDEDPTRNHKWKFYFNHHPWEEINTKNLIDPWATQLLGKKVLITDGLPVFKASFDGTVDMKMYFYCQAGHNLACGFLKTPFDNTLSGYNIDSNLKLRDFDDTKYTTNMWPINQEVELRMDVKQGDILWIKAIDTNDTSAFVGAKTTQITLKSNKE